MKKITVSSRYLSEGIYFFVLTFKLRVIERRHVSSWQGRKSSLPFLFNSPSLSPREENQAFTPFTIPLPFPLRKKIKPSLPFQFPFPFPQGRKSSLHSLFNSPSLPLGKKIKPTLPFQFPFPFLQGKKSSLPLSIGKKIKLSLPLPFPFPFFPFPSILPSPSLLPHLGFFPQGRKSSFPLSIGKKIKPSLHSPFPFPFFPIPFPFPSPFFPSLLPGLGSRSRVFLAPWSRSRLKKKTRSQSRSRLEKKSGAGSPALPSSPLDFLPRQLDIIQVNFAFR